jgi:hypothetical protein
MKAAPVYRPAAMMKQAPAASAVQRYITKGTVVYYPAETVFTQKSIACEL